MRSKGLFVIVCAFVAAGAFGCAHQQKTPYDHLYGDEWCRGVYKGYADEFDDTAQAAKAAVMESYKVLAREGVESLKKLQGRKTPFHVYTDAAEDRFVVKREVPDRLTYTADMTEADRERARVVFEEGRKDLATDYADVERLEWALNGLFDQLAAVGLASRKADDELLNAAYIRASMNEGELPFELPYQVSVALYEEVLLMVMARMEREKTRLARLEAGVVAVALSVRATDESGQSAAANVEAAILAAVEDLTSEQRPDSSLPVGEARSREVGAGEEIWTRVVASQEYARFVAAQKESGPDPLGAILGIVDSVAGTRLASVAKQVRAVIHGEHPDYLELLKTAAGFVPNGTAVSQLLDGAVEVTEQYRSVVAKIEKVEKVGREAIKLKDALADEKLSLEAVTNLEGSLGGAEEQIVFLGEKAAQQAVRDKLKGLGVL